MTLQYVVLDTNIYYRFAARGHIESGIEDWEYLLSSIENQSVRLLLPEIILFECQIKFRQLRKVFESHISGLIGKMTDPIEKGNKEPVWNEIEDLPQEFKKLMNACKVERINAACERSKRVLDLLRSARIELIEFTPETFFESKKRMLAGNFTSSKQLAESDCFIFQSLVKFFTHRREDSQLLFCTENKSDFAIEAKGAYVLNSILEEGLPPTQVFLNLADLVKFVKEQRQVVAPTPEELEEAERAAEEKSRLETLQESEVSLKSDDKPTWHEFLANVSAYESNAAAELAAASAIRDQFDGLRTLSNVAQILSTSTSLKDVGIKNQLDGLSTIRKQMDGMRTLSNVAQMISESTSLADLGTKGQLSGLSAIREELDCMRSLTATANAMKTLASSIEDISSSVANHQLAKIAAGYEEQIDSMRSSDSAGRTIPEGDVPNSEIGKSANDRT